MHECPWCRIKPQLAGTCRYSIRLRPSSRITERDSSSDATCNCGGGRGSSSGQAVATAGVAAWEPACTLGADLHPRAARGQGARQAPEAGHQVSAAQHRSTRRCVRRSKALAMIQ